jgi:hypothetical protein
MRGMPYHVGHLDPSAGPDDGANAPWLGADTLGIEVTVPALADACGLGNLDPQHHGAGAGRCAAEAGVTWPLPPEGARLVTVRPDLDAHAAMAVLTMRRRGDPMTDAVRRRLTAVADQDAFDQGDWPGPAAEPARPDAIRARAETGLAGANAAVRDADLTPARRVAIVRAWLRSGRVPAKHRRQVRRFYDDLARAVESGEIDLQTIESGQLAWIQGSHAGALRLGYDLAPVVVALNPAHRVGTAPPHRKFTVCQYAPGHVDLSAVLARLRELEPGWGGSATIVGSPQGRDSTLEAGDVIAAVRAHLHA